MQANEGTLMSALHTGALIIASLHLAGHADTVRIAFETGKVLVFDDSDRANSLNTEICFNAVARNGVRRKMERLNAKGQVPALYGRKIVNFFRATLSDPYEVVSYHFQGRPVSDFCERRDLIVIEKAKRIDGL